MIFPVDHSLIWYMILAIDYAVINADGIFYFIFLSKQISDAMTFFARDMNMLYHVDCRVILLLSPDEWCSLFG